MHKDINVNVSGPMQPTSQYKTVVLKGNLPFALQVTEPNMKYVIKHDFNLGGAEITIPANCILEFDGGSLSNGAIVGNNTGIEAGLDNIFNIDITLSGTWNVADVFPEWFGAKGDGITNDYVSLQLMFDSLNTCLPQIQVTPDNIVRDYRNVSIKFNGTYLTSKPIVLKSAFGLILYDFNLKATNDFEAIAYSHWSDQMKGLINIVGIQYNTVIDSCIFDGNTKADCLALYDYTLDTNISKCYIRRFVKYGIYGTSNGYELKIDNTKIGQREYNSELDVYSQGTGIYLESGRNDNNFENVIICYCATCSFNLKSGTNYIANSHFYSGNKYSEIANVNTINNCYFDGEGLKSGGANKISGCYFGTSVTETSHKFIILSNAGKPIDWIYEMEYIEGNTFRSNSNTLLGIPVGLPEDYSGDKTLDQFHVSFFNNVFWRVTKYLSYSPSVDTVKPLQTSEVKSHIKIIQNDLPSQDYAENGQTVMLFGSDGTPNGKTILRNPITNTTNGIGTGKESYQIGHLLIQCGTCADNTINSVTFKTSYASNITPTVFLAPLLGTTLSNLYAYNVSKAGFAVGTSCNWIAIGYAQ